MNISEIANKAADIIEENGLAKFSLHNPVAGSYCARGAIMAAVVPEWSCAFELSVRGWRNPDFTRVDKEFSEMVGRDTGHWNNDNKRTKEEVVQALRDLAIKHASDEYTEIGIGNE